jgi:RNA polymerase subunit RPABC4/transcription elongation factor Spt4
MSTDVCPRCRGFIPNDVTPGAFPGALSRTDNETEICSECGTFEAIEQWFLPTGLMPQEQWAAIRETN